MNAANPISIDKVYAVIRKTVKSCVNLPAWLGADWTANLIEEALTAALTAQVNDPLCGENLVQRTRRLSRAIVRREQHEARHTEGGKRLSRTVMRVEHPRSAEMEGWTEPLDRVVQDADGHTVGQHKDHGNRNLIEDRIIARIDSNRTIARIARRVSRDDLHFLLNYALNRRRGQAATGADRVRFLRLKRRLEIFL